MQERGDGDEDSQGVADSLKDDFEAGEENALIGVAAPDDFNPGVPKVPSKTGDDEKRDESKLVNAEPSEQDLWDKVHAKGKKKAESMVISDVKPAKRQS